MFCFYHSIMDWHHPDRAPTTRRGNAGESNPDMERFVELPQGLRTRHDYNPGVLWFDGEWEEWTHQRGLDLYAYVRGLNPGIIINNRVDKGRPGMKGMIRTKVMGDFGTPEQEIPEGVRDCRLGILHDDERYLGIQVTTTQNWKSTETLVRNLIDIASKGGNYLLNVGPTGDGEFQQHRWSASPPSASG